MEKKGVYIEKEGRGEKAQYYINKDTNHALTLTEEKDRREVISSENLKMNSLDFQVFTTIVLAPMQVYRGSYYSFLRYMELDPCESNIEVLKKVLQYLADKELITYTIDKTDNTYFLAGILHKAEENMQIGITMEVKCRLLAVKYKKRDWVQLYKVWLAVQYTYEQNLQPFTIAEISEMTGLSDHQIRNNMKILGTEDYFNKTSAYRIFGDEIKRLGTYAEPNVIKEDFY